MALSIIIFFVIVLVFIVTILGSWVYNRFSLKRHFLSFSSLDESLIKKYNLMDYSLIDKKTVWLNFSIWNIILYFLNHILLLFPFLIFENENQTLFIASIVLIVLGSVICLVINFIISNQLFKKEYYKIKELIQLNKNEFISKLSLYKYNEVNEFTKTNIYNFRDKIFQKHLNKSLANLKFKTNEQWINKHYITFLKYAHFFIFNLNRSGIYYANTDDFKTICDQTLNNLMVKINDNYISNNK